MLSRFFTKEIGFLSRRSITPIFSNSVKATTTFNYNTFSFNNQLITKRFNTTTDGSRSQTIGQIKVDKPELMIAFKCKKCDTRSSHVMSKQAYTSGTVLVTCPGCKNRHLIADHLKIFSDDRITIQDILAARGESVSQSTDDLVFDEIPDKLKDLIGHHARNSPLKSNVNNEEDPQFLPEAKK